MACARIILVLVLGAAAIGCGSKPSSTSRTNGNVNASNELAMPAGQAAQGGERLLDTGNPGAPAVAARPPAPATTFAAPPKTQKPGSDENLPAWVPVRGRLTVVQVPDLAENLGLAPKGSSRNADTRVTVADALAQRGAPAVATDTSQRSATWLASNGRVRRARR